MKRTIIKLFVICLLSGLQACKQNSGGQDAAIIQPASIDLRPEQTRLKAQGSRSTCITFAAMAAMEAAYKRAGYGDLNLSEEFTNHIGKMTWLHLNWDAPRDRDMNGIVDDTNFDGIPDEDALENKSADYAESQVSAFGGGGGMSYIEQLANGMAVPLEEVMPYTSNPVDLTPFCATCDDYRDVYWDSQRNVNDYNLDSSRLTLEMLAADEYYSVQSFSMITANDPVAIEAALVQHREVVWDFSLAGDFSGELWVPSDADSVGGHSMLIVGYDRTDPDNPFFIVKNSWGTSGADASGWTRISYDYLRAYGHTAGYIEAINPPRTWPELAFIGKWDFSFDGHQGELHIYHLPGLMQPIFDKTTSPDDLTAIVDRRIGTYYDQAGNAFRVNGNIHGREITFYIDSDNPNLRWDQRSGRRFHYYLFEQMQILMAGFHTDPDGSVWAGYARKFSFLNARYDSLRPLVPESYLGEWHVNMNGIQGTLILDDRDDSVADAVPGTAAGLTGVFYPTDLAGSTYAHATVPFADSASIIIWTGIEGSLSLQGKHLNHEPGVIAGDIGGPGAVPGGFVAVRISEANSLSAINMLSPGYGLLLTAIKSDAIGWFVDLHLEVEVVDLVDGILDNKDLVWTDAVNGKAPGVIAYGAIGDVQLYAPLCGVNSHEITITATNNLGMSRSKTVYVDVTLDCIN